MGLLCRNQGRFAHDFGDHPGDVKSVRPCFSAGAMGFALQRTNAKCKIENDVRGCHISVFEGSCKKGKRKIYVLYPHQKYDKTYWP